MSNQTIIDLLLEQIGVYSFYVFQILSAVIAVGVAYLLYWLGKRAIQNSIMCSFGEAFNLHGEAKNKKRDEDGFAEDGSYVDPLVSALYDEDKNYGRRKLRKGEPF